jgi:hypothetical protein
MELRTDDGVVVARVVDGIMIAKRQESKHKLRRPEGWAFDSTVIEQAQNAGARRIRITCGDTGVTYRVLFSDFMDNAFPLNRGFNNQLVLVLKYWDTGEQSEQLSLFGGN